MTPEQAVAYWNKHQDVRALIAFVGAEARRDALEEAAKVCESQWSNAAEKLYGMECAADIRKLKEDIQ